jgi:predicted ATPase
MGTLAEPVLVGRDEELKELQALLYSAVEGKGNAVFVSGEAGSGKTSLVRDFLNSTKSKGVTVLAGWCLSDAATPYFPFIEAFNSYFNRLEQEQPMNLHRPGEPLGFAGTGQAANMNWGITAWLAGPKPAERPGKPKVVSPEVWKDQVFAGVAGTLHAMASEEPIILFIEDIHWADSASIALLHYIARSIYNSERILVLATFRSEELTADAEGRSHPLHETLRLMKREELFKEIKLSGLEQDSVKSIAQSML